YFLRRQPGVLREAHEREPAPGKFCDDGRGPPTDGGPRRPITQIGEHIAARLPEYLVVAQHPYDVAAHRPRVLAPPGLRLAFGHLIHVDVARLGFRRAHPVPQRLPSGKLLAAPHDQPARNHDRSETLVGRHALSPTLVRLRPKHSVGFAM